MAKVAKKKTREPTIHSRAHRRAASPPPKDLAVKPSTTSHNEDDETYKPWLHNAQNAGISKKSKKPKPMSRQQKVRQQRAMEKADANLDKLATKVKGSKARARRVQDRRVEWEELNGTSTAEERGQGNAEVGGAPAAEKGDEEEERVELDVGMGEAEAVVNGTEGEEMNELAAEAVALPEAEEDEEL